MSKGGGSTRSKSPKKDTNLLELAQKEYYEYTHGGGYYYEIMGEYSHMEAVFSGAKNDMTLYRGTTTEELKPLLKDVGVKNIEDYKKAEGKEFISKNYKSTSTNIKTADDFASDVYDRFDDDGEYVLDHPVIVRYNIAKGTPIVERKDERRFGARGGDGEHTLGRNVSMKIKSIKRERTPMDSSYRKGKKAYRYYVEIDVKKK